MKEHSAANVTQFRYRSNILSWSASALLTSGKETNNRLSGIAGADEPVDIDGGRNYVVSRPFNATPVPKLPRRQRDLEDAADAYG
jgi:hypothetical protein